MPRALLRSLLGSAGIRLGGALFGFTVGVQLARTLGADGYGIYGVGMTIVALMTVLTEFGLPALITREVAAAQAGGGWGRIRGMLNWARRLSGTLAGAVALLCIVWVFAFETQDDVQAQVIAIGVLIVPLVAIGNQASAALAGMQHVVRGQLSETLIRPACMSLLLFTFSLAGLGLSPASAMVISVVAAAAGMTSATTMFRRQSPQPLRTAPPTLHIGLWLQSAVPMAVAEAARVLHGHLPILMLGVIASAGDVGVFRVASSVSVFLGMPTTLFGVVAAPRLARLHILGEGDALRGAAIQTSLAMVACTIVTVLPFVFFGRDVLVFVFGEQYAGAHGPLAILCLAVVATSVGGASSVLLNMTGHEGRVTRATLVALCVLVGLLPPMCMWFQGSGAAVAVLGSVLMWRVMLVRDVRRVFGWRIIPPLRWGRGSQRS